MHFDIFFIHICFLIEHFLRLRFLIDLRFRPYIYTHSHGKAHRQCWRMVCGCRLPITRKLQSLGSIDSVREFVDNEYKTSIAYLALQVHKKSASVWEWWQYFCPFYGSKYNRRCTVSQLSHRKVRSAVAALTLRSLRSLRCSVNDFSTP